MDERPPYDAGHAPAPTPVPVPDTPRGFYGALSAALEHERACWDAHIVADREGWGATWRAEAGGRWRDARGLVAQLRGVIGVGTGEKVG